MSSLLSSRRSARRRQSPQDDSEPAGLSPWHFLGVGLIALMVTGVLAAMDRFQARTAPQVARPPLIKAPAAQTARLPEAPPPVALVEAPRPTVRAAAPSTPSVASATPTSDPAQSHGSAIVRAAPSVPAAASAYQPALPYRFAAVFGEPAPAAPAAPVVADRAAPRPAVERPSPPMATPISPPLPVERASRSAEGPVATASLQPPAPPVRQPETAVNAARDTMKGSAAAPTECLPNALRAVLADVSAQFGDITIVSTHQLNTANHSPGSIREKLHHACNAVDIRPDRERIEEIKRYLRGRPEIGGVESYRNGVVHMDLKGSEVASPRRQTTAQATSAETAQAPPAAAPAGESSGLFRLFGR